MHKGGERRFITDLLPYLQGEIDLEVVWLHFPDEEIYKPMENEVSHIIRLFGNPIEKILYAYIELFNIHNFIVKLSEEYDGIRIDETYHYDLIESKELFTTIPLDYSREQLLENFINKNHELLKEIERRSDRVISIARNR